MTRQWTLKNAAKHLGITLNCLKLRRRKGTLRTREDQRGEFMDESDIAHARKNRPKIGRPRTNGTK